MDLLIFQVPILMVQASLDGILLGILFALIAYGMALQWGVMNIINIAQGDLVILGGYITYFMYLSGIHYLFYVSFRDTSSFRCNSCSCHNVFCRGRSLQISN